MRGRSALVKIVQVDGSASVGPLPFALTPLIGREAQVAAVAERLMSAAIRLLTLIGPGGIGKTRLGLEAAHAVSGFYEDGAYLLRLAAVTDHALVAVSLARALNVRGATDDPAAWAIARDRRCLLVIDNFEHVLAAAPSVVEVLANCPHVTMLVTSRVPLHVSGEYEYPVPHLTTPPDDAGADPAMLGQAAAVRLFVERAVAVRPDFRLTGENAAAVARITRQLDGLPLAIELAAARSKHLSPQAIVDRLVVTSADLQGGPVDRPPHQRAMRDSIAWSYDLLGPGEQLVFRRLAVFAGGFSPRAAAYVCGAGDDHLVIQLPDAAEGGVQSILTHCFSLADKNLIVPSDEPRDDLRFAMLLTIRGFAHAELQRLGEWAEAGHRHAAWYLALARSAAPAIRGPSQAVWLDWLQIEYPNLRLALDWFRTHGETAEFAELANALGTFWLVRGHLVEGLRWVRMVFAVEGSGSIAPLVRVDLLCAAGWLALRQGLPEDGRVYADESLTAARASASPVRVAAALRLLGDIEDRVSNYGRAKELLGESLAAYREAGDGIGVADTLTGLAGIAMDTGDFGEAERVFRAAVAAATAIGDAIILARAIDSLSVVLLVNGDAAAGIDYAERALELYRTHGNVRGIAVAMDHVGKCARALDDPIRAWSCHRESLAWRRKVGDPRGMVVWLEAMAGLLASCDACDTAACVLGGVDSLRERGGFPIHTQETAQLQPAVRRISEHLPPEQVARARVRGSQMPLAEIVDLAYAEADRVVTAMGGEHRGVPVDVVDVLAGFGLTRRERGVARLLMLRLSDKEIAGRLSISSRTVSNHVAVILGKVGVDSRHDVARLASEAARDGSDEGDRPAPAASVR